ncbi:TIGR01440 family protein [Aneurinibacillus terranovensis]|uniref:TIGR01440 family protein n=1 Tax=Aneurinibacillus terranovensis TaxID=278991 RepID=UPI00047FBA33|nr:TIGR01440 family protein [Aneurinibacillus terranovensis]
MEKLKQDAQSIVAELLQSAPLGEKHVLVIGTSTSEVIGKQIGTAGSVEVAAALYSIFKEASERHGFALAFQCCEHLNRALVVERTTAERYSWPEVSAVPVPKAGGSMAAGAFQKMNDPVLVEYIQADAGIDIGDTFIGMHLKPVAVPVRPSVKQLGEAHVTMARTRPKLIGGARAVYERSSAEESCT